MLKNRIQFVKKLEQQTIIKYFSEVNPDDLLDIYDVMINKFFDGDLREEFESDYVDDSNKKELVDLANKYKSLCFYQGDIDLWTDSVEGVTLNDPKFVCAELFDNYDYLIKLAKDGGEDTLKFLLNFKDSRYSHKSSIIDSMRNYFGNDELLSSILVNMSKEDGAYKNFTLEEKLTLFTYPEGLLFKNNFRETSLIPVTDLEEKYKKAVIGDDNDISIEDILKTIPIKDFNDITSRLYGDYQEKYGYGK